jgi:hypothetical protein
MNLWLLSRTDDVSWDEYEAVVVAAESPQRAMEIHPDGNATFNGTDWRTARGFTDGQTWADPNSLKVDFLGTAKPGTRAGVILASFRAG